MSGWKRRAIGDMPAYQAVTLSWLPGFVQGFTTRRGGVSAAPYDTLNLSLKVGDDPLAVQTNRERLWTDLGYTAANVALAEQVHGDGVGQVTGGSAVPMTGMDALITDTPNVLLMMLYADCMPIYVIDPVRRAIGLIHAGWRGAAANLPGKTIAALAERFDALPSRCLAAIGPCIGGESYEVGREVADQFRNFPGGRNSGAATAVIPKNEFAGKYYLNLRQIAFVQLLAAGLRADAISVCDADTFRNGREFFSFRRQGVTSGRMAAFLGMRGDQALSR